MPDQPHALEHQDRQVGEGVDAVQEVADLPPTSSRSAVLSRLARTGTTAPVADPVEQPDEARARLGEGGDPGGHLGGTAEHVDATGRDVPVHEAPIGAPVQPRAQRRIGSPDALADGDVALAHSKAGEERLDDLGGFLEVRGHHGDVLAARVREAGPDRRERPEVPRQGDQLGRQRGVPEGRPDDIRRIVRRAIHDEHHLHGAILPGSQLHETRDDVGDRVPVSVHRDDHRVADAGGHAPAVPDDRSTSATRTTSSSVIDGKQGRVRISLAATSVSRRSVTRDGGGRPGWR